MAAITWQNINGPSLAEATRPMEAASRSFTGAFDGLANVLKQREATNAANWDQAKVNNTNALLGAVQEPKTPEEFAAKEAQLRQQLLGYGAQVDPVAARAALDNRMATLQQRGLANIQYTGAVAEEADRPKRDLALSLYAKGDIAGGDAVAAEVQRNKAALAEASHKWQRTGVTEKQTDTKFDFDQAAEAQKVLERPLLIDKLNSDLLTAKAQRTLSGAQADALGREKNANSPATKAQDAAYEQLLKDNLFGGGSLEPGRNLAEVSKYVKASITDPKEADGLTRAIAKLSSQKFDVGNGMKVGVPISLLQEALHLSQDTNWKINPWNNRVSNFEELIKKRMADPDVAQQALAAQQIAANRDARSLGLINRTVPGNAAEATQAQVRAVGGTYDPEKKTLLE